MERITHKVEILSIMGGSITREIHSHEKSTRQSMEINNNKLKMDQSYASKIMKW
jgi:hypothetical protein